MAELQPFLMYPAFRAGRLTPWGGTKLRTLYHKPAPEETPGESLEVSCIPGLESRNSSGQTLTELIAIHGSDLVGRFANKPFPLLLKFIDAKDTLSVQVHPDDSYAWEHEKKLGKNEAWLILSADPGSEIIYGLRDGVTRDELQEACAEGSAVRNLLRHVPVKEGDVFEIPSGAVHAIGRGIMVFELQQSSDITYRLYDWDRKDKNGSSRELHIKQALDIVDLNFHRDVLKEKMEPMIRTVSNDYFTLDLMHLEGEQRLPDIQDFAMLTSFTDGLTLCSGEHRLTVNNGDTAFIPCTAQPPVLKGHGRAAYAMPVYKE